MSSLISTPPKRRYCRDVPRPQHPVHLASRAKHEVTATPWRSIPPGRSPPQPVRSRSMGAARLLPSEAGRTFLMPSWRPPATLLTTPLHTQQPFTFKTPGEKQTPTRCGCTEPMVPKEVCAECLAKYPSVSAGKGGRGFHLAKSAASLARSAQLLSSGLPLAALQIWER